MSTLVTYSRSGPISRIVMDDGKVNALNLAMLKELHAAFDQAEHDQTIVVLTGRDKTFSAGFDLKVLAAGSAADVHAMFQAGGTLALRVLAFPTPVVAACNGHGIAMGAFLLLAADARIAADGPYKIGLNEVTLGLAIPQFGVELARQRLTPAYLNRGLVLGETFAPAEAAVAGYVDRAVPAEAWAAVVEQTADALSAINLPAHAATKMQVRGASIAAVRAAIDTEFTLENIERLLAQRRG